MSESVYLLDFIYPCQLGFGCLPPPARSFSLLFVPRIEALFSCLCMYFVFVCLVMSVSLFSSSLFLKSVKITTTNLWSSVALFTLQITLRLQSICRENNTNKISLTNIMFNNPIMLLSFIVNKCVLECLYLFPSITSSFLLHFRHSGQYPIFSFFAGNRLNSYLAHRYQHVTTKISSTPDLSSPPPFPLSFPPCIPVQFYRHESLISRVSSYCFCCYLLPIS